MANNTPAQPPKPASPTAGELLKDLNRLEDKTIGGARLLTPKQQLFDVSDVEAKHPDKRVKWLNLRDEQKLAARKQEGYVRLGTEEGGKSLGSEMATFVIPKKVYEEKVERLKQINRERLTAHTKEMSGVVESVLRELRDRHGIKIDERRLLVNEG